MVQDIDYTALRKRIGRLHLKQRMNIQANYVAKLFSFNRRHIHIENMFWLHNVLSWALKATFLHSRAAGNALGIEVRNNKVDIPDLPENFNGYRILQMSDLHLDIDERLTDAIVERLEGLEYDLCVLTGDYRFLTFGPYDKAIAYMAELVEHIQSPIYGILGNHDFIEMVFSLEEMGISILLNESVPISRGNSTIYLAGVDDDFYYEVANLGKATDTIPDNSTAILLSHSPELYRKASYLDFSLMLSGHTHGGQICLPGSLSVTTNSSAPRRYSRGKWQYHSMHGYTSAGTGSSGILARFNCPPEITIHTLKTR